MRVLSLFDGISCGRLALKRAGIKVDTYYASEIDKYCIKIAQKNYPDIIQIGNVNDINFKEYIDKVDIIMGGSPCQDLSVAKQNRKGLKGDQSKLFFKFVEAVETIKPKYFLYENVASIKKDDKNVITEELRVEPILINSALVSAQNRKRLYWTNIPGVEQPEDKGILLTDVLLDGVVDRDKSRSIIGSIGRTIAREYFKKYQGQMVYDLGKLKHSERAIEYMDRERKDGRTGWDFEHHSDIRDNKSSAVVANFFKGVPYNVLKDDKIVRKLHPVECERLQTLPDNYTEGVSNTQRYKMIGNGWTIDVIAHILSYIEDN